MKDFNKKTYLSKNLKRIIIYLFSMNKKKLRN